METPALLHPKVREILEGQTEKIFELVKAHGAIVHFLLPEVFLENVYRFKKVLEELGLTSEMTYACKANKGEAFLEACAYSDIGVEVSSIYELRKALSHGIRGNQIGVSGPMKTPECLLLALRHQARISVDSFEELQILAKVMKRASAQQASILLRLNDFTPRKSRFGVEREKLPEILNFLKAHREIIFLGFGFHLDGYSIEERSHAIELVLEEMQKAREQELPCSTMNIGGGFSVDYISAESWGRFQDGKAKDDNFYQGRTFPHYYPYHSSPASAEHLRGILEIPHTLDARKRIFEVLREKNITLVLEPGRALLDQAGFTAMRVRGSRCIRGDNVVVVDGNSNHLSEQWFNTQFLPDPLLREENGSEPKNDVQPFVGAVTGNTCLESDVLNWKKVSFPREPKRGDILLYPNTTGYQMDSNETEFHGIPIPPKVVLLKSSSGLRWKIDTSFSQLDFPSPRST